MAVEARIKKWETKIKEKEDRLHRQIALQKERSNYDTQSSFTKLQNTLMCKQKKTENQLEFERIKTKRLARKGSLRNKLSYKQQEENETQYLLQKYLQCKTQEELRIDKARHHWNIIKKKKKVLRILVQ